MLQRTRTAAHGAQQVTLQDCRSPAGADRAPARHVVRLALTDGARFHGNICCLDPAQIRPGGISWSLEGGALLLRACSRDGGSGDRRPLQVWLLTSLRVT